MLNWALSKHFVCFQTVYGQLYLYQPHISNRYDYSKHFVLKQEIDKKRGIESVFFFRFQDKERKIHKYLTKFHNYLI